MREERAARFELLDGAGKYLAVADTIRAERLDHLSKETLRSMIRFLASLLVERIGEKNE